MGGGKEEDTQHRSQSVTVGTAGACHEDGKCLISLCKTAKVTAKPQASSGFIWKEKNSIVHLDSLRAVSLLPSPSTEVPSAQSFTPLSQSPTVVFQDALQNQKKRGNDCTVQKEWKGLWRVIKPLIYMETAHAIHYQAARPPACLSADSLSIPACSQGCGPCWHFIPLTSLVFLSPTNSRSDLTASSSRVQQLKINVVSAWKVEKSRSFNVMPDLFTFKPYPCASRHQARSVTFPQQTANAFFLSAAN